MGEVYLVQHPRLPRRTALKVLPADVSADPEYRARFNREADLASTLWHPHIVSVHDRGEQAAGSGSRWTLSTVKMRLAFSPTVTRPATQGTFPLIAIVLLVIGLAM